MIPEAAVEAAARGVHSALGFGAWDDRFAEVYFRAARAALEAAEPYMLAEGWDEGYEACSRDEENSYWGSRAVTTPNPYRSQA